ncbi:hypothetical protein QBC40DRAFT_334076 [Triangularia verruculosa]|uniref:Uncharacterized protein n=1 Tax=Triangularia verruculosa TaxID=2587418 RepID=A0AAN7AS42_9PEZI|nr:hypothetical protein QBC40DRAFT_334076 [Triangularia verruculosa]
MSNRVKKSTPKGPSSTLRRQNLAAAASIFGDEMLPCSSCEALNISDCRVFKRSSKCNHCISSGRSDCDILGLTPALTASLRRQKEKLDAEEQKARTTMLQAASKLSRVDTQRRALTAKFRRIAAREERLIEDLEREEAQPSSTANPPLTSSLDWASAMLGWPGQNLPDDPSFDLPSGPDLFLEPVAGPSRSSPPLAAPGSSDGSPPVSQGS